MKSRLHREESGHSVLVFLFVQRGDWDTVCHHLVPVLSPHGQVMWGHDERPSVRGIGERCNRDREERPSKEEKVVGETDVDFTLTVSDGRDPRLVAGRTSTY